MLCYDPRDSTQESNNRRTWRETENPALILAHMAAEKGHIIFWPTVIAMAQYCDKLVKVKKRPH